MVAVQDALSRARTLHQQGDLRQSAQICQQILQSDPANADALYLLGAALLISGQLTQAAQVFGQFVRVRPEHAEGHHHLATALAKQERYPEAAAEFQQAIRLNNRLFDAHFGLGLTCSRLGLPGDAATAFRQATQVNPQSAEAFNHLGVSLGKLGQTAQAIECYQQALSVRPAYPEALYNMGIDLGRLGRQEEAITAMQQAVRLRPDHPDAHFSLGILLSQADRTQEAVAAYRQVLRIRPEHLEALNNMGAALGKLGQFEEAAACFQHVVDLKPDNADALNNLGMALVALKRHADAVPVYQQALHVRPEHAEVYNNLGLAFRNLEKHEEAQACFRQATRIKPDFAEAHCHLGVALADRGESEKAVASYRKALKTRPDYAEALNNLGHALLWLGKLEEAGQHFDEAVALRPDLIDVHLNRSILWLLQGKLEIGWPEYEWRLRQESTTRPNVPGPAWDGSPLAGKTIVLYPEQGIGDIIQFVRYAPLVQKRGAKVLVLVPESLKDLIATCPGIDQVIPRGSVLPEYDYQASLLSLPYLLKTSIETIPADVPYLFPSRERVAQWSARLSLQKGVRVGICWQGNPKHKRDYARSIPLAQFVPLAKVPGVKLISLQIGPGREQLANWPSDLDLFDLGEEIASVSGTFADTAAALKSLDLVICCDTSIAHLAGAIGIPVWVAVPTVPDWRWLLEREDTPWYPTMRLFRQKRAGDWEMVFSRIVQALGDRKAAASVAVGAADGTIAVEISPGELIDRITILEVRAQRIDDPRPLEQVQAELAALNALRERTIRSPDAIETFVRELRTVNAEIWTLRDETRGCERQGNFGQRFVDLVRALHRKTDRRATLKQEINRALGADRSELKRYTTRPAAAPKSS